MYSNNTPQTTLVHLSRPHHPANEPRLPRGECRFILPDVEPDGSRQRCTCVSFSLNNSVPGAQCGCGHQAWHHIAESTDNYVTIEDHLILVERAKRLEESVKGLQEELSREKRERERVESNFAELTRGNYKSMARLRYYVDEKIEALRITQDDKLEGILDRAQGATDEVEKLKARFSDLDETSMRLEEKVDSGRWHSRSLTPLHETHPEASSSTPVPSAVLPIRSDEKHPNGWSCRVILVPSRSQSFAYEVDSVAYRRCQSRGLNQDIHLQDHGSQAFTQCVEAAFGTILRGRPWMPLQCLRSENRALTELPKNDVNLSKWDYVFLESQCMASNKREGDVIYIALQEEDLSWSDIRSLPRVFGSDESVWEVDDQLDSRNASIDSRMDFQMVHDFNEQPKHDFNKPIDSDSVYEYSPPPYSSRYPSMITGVLSSPLNVLASTASFMRDNQSLHSIQSIQSIQSSQSVLTNGSEEQLDGADTDDEHRDKRTKRIAGRSEPHPDKPQFIYSGRTKRKIPSGKQKEPMDWRVSELKISNPMKGFMHKHDSKGKHTQQQGQPQSPPQQQPQQQQQQQPDQASHS
jgi:hypothetical protein